MLIKELQSLSLDVKVFTEANEELEIKENEDEDDVEETAKELEIDGKSSPSSRAIKKSAPALDEEEEDDEEEEEEEEAVVEDTGSDI